MHRQCSNETVECGCLACAAFVHVTLVQALMQADHEIDILRTTICRWRCVFCMFGARELRHRRRSEDDPITALSLA